MGLAAGTARLTLRFFYTEPRQRRTVVTPSLGQGGRGEGGFLPEMRQSMSGIAFYLRLISTISVAS